MSVRHIHGKGTGFFYGACIVILCGACGIATVLHAQSTKSNGAAGMAQDSKKNGWPPPCQDALSEGSNDLPVQANRNADQQAQSTHNENCHVVDRQKGDGNSGPSQTLPGQFASTANPQVAVYKISPDRPGKIFVQFGKDANYGLVTWTQLVPGAGIQISLLVAGMEAHTIYHMRGVVNFDDGTKFIDADQTFTTGDAITPAKLPQITTSIAAGMTPEPGVELLDITGASTTVAPLLVTDLNGNILWSYDPGPVGLWGPIKLLPNGHFLIGFSQGLGAESVLQEVDLAGTVVWQLSAADLNNALSVATCAGCNITVVGTHHDFAVLPYGHIVVIATYQRDISGTTVTADVLIELDQNHKPVWLWNEFDHLDINRRPMQFPDWTHTNAVIYSPDDGNLIVSLRHQNWLIKVNFANGAGNGEVLWKLGYQGDFALLGGTDPTDWFYAQHSPAFVSTNTTGTFRIALFDNGNDRSFAPGVSCGTIAPPACLYSTVPVMEIDEVRRTATLGFHLTTPDYSFFGGNAEVLSGGHVEFTESATGDVYEVSQTASPKEVWHLHVPNQYIYRGFRLPSLYPGVQW